MDRKCANCDRQAEKVRNEAYYCLRHYRIRQMRGDAKESGKSIPSFELLESLFDDAEASGFVCSVCCREMNLVRSGGQSTTISLQHDRDGGYRLICLGCNVKHQFCPGDSFYDVPEGTKRCNACGFVLPKTEFYRSKHSPNGLRSACKECGKSSAMKWISDKRKAAKR